MKKYALALSAVLLAGAQFAQADECSFTLNSNDAMQFDQKSITVNKTCKEFTLNLVHTGKLPKTVMGHNWVLATTADSKAVASEGMAAGADKDYVKADDARVIAHTKLIGGGETTSVTFPVSKLTAGTEYTYFCSFPGHIALMQGTLSLAP
ncbi:MAG TPA: azurin [Cellvibrio sp.]|nr:azurin [Cellvibrio sp.]